MTPREQLVDLLAFGPMAQYTRDSHHEADRMNLAQAGADSLIDSGYYREPPPPQ